MSFMSGMKKCYLCVAAAVAASILLLEGCNFRTTIGIERDPNLWKAPEEPRELTVTDISYNTARLIWTAPANFGFRDGEEFTSKRYEVQYSKNEKFDNSAEVFTFYTDATEFLLRGLSTGETYYARVRATNDSEIDAYRMSAYRNLSSPRAYFTTKGVPALTGPENLLATDIKLPSANAASEVLISWDPPLGSGYDPNKEGLIADIASYDLLMVSGLDFNTPVASNRMEKRNMPAMGALEEKITGFIRPGRVYSVRVTARNSAGGSAESMLVFSTDNLSSLPSQATALNARTGPTGNQHVALGWNDPLSNGLKPDSSPATLVSYEIEYSKDPNFQGTTTKVEAAPAGITKPYELTALFDSDMVYYFRVRIINSEGQRSLYSSSLTFRTNNASTGPDEVSVSATAYSRSLDVTWAEPSNKGRNKDGSLAQSIVSYYLRYSTTESDVRSDITITNDEKGSVPLPGTTRRARIPNLKPYTDYYLAVVATNENNLPSGVATPIYRIKTLSVAAPPAVPLSIVALRLMADNDKRHFHKVKLQWDTPSVGALGRDDVGNNNTQILEYKVYVTKVGGLDPVAATRNKGLAVMEKTFGQGAYQVAGGKVSVELDILDIYPQTEIGNLTEVAARAFSISLEAISTKNSGADKLASPKATIAYRFPDRIKEIYVGVKNRTTPGVEIGNFEIQKLGGTPITAPAGTFTVYEVDSSYNRLAGVTPADMADYHYKTGTLGQWEAIFQINIRDDNQVEADLIEAAMISSTFRRSPAVFDYVLYKVLYLSGTLKEGTGQPDRFITRIGRNDGTYTIAF